MTANLATIKPIHVGFTNCFPIDTGDGIALVDTGLDTDENWERLDRGVKELGYTWQDVRWVLLTHAHTDHAGLVPRVRDVADVEVLIHEDEAFLLREETGHRQVNRENYRHLGEEHGLPESLLALLPKLLTLHVTRRTAQDFPLFEKAPNYTLRNEVFHRLRDEFDPLLGTDTGHTLPPTSVRAAVRTLQQRPIEPDRTFADDEQITLGNLRVQAIGTPGHTPGHACFYDGEAGVIFTGDHILKRITPNPLLYFLNDEYEQRTKSLPNYIRSLMRVRNLQARRVLGAHEGEMNNLEYAADRILLHHERRARTVMGAVRHGRTTSFEVMPVLFPTLRLSGLFLGLDETIGHMDLLEEQGQVRQEMQEGQRRYLPMEE